MKSIKKYLLIFLTTIIMLTGCSQITEDNYNINSAIEETQYYYNLDDVVNYIDEYDRLPLNYITKREAQKLGWDNKKGNLWEVKERAVIGGDKFHNREKKLPQDKNTQYYEADINYNGGYRGAERLIYTKDGDYYYTKDHYKSFKKIEVK